MNKSYYDDVDVLYDRFIDVELYSAHPFDSPNDNYKTIITPLDNDHMIHIMLVPTDSGTGRLYTYETLSDTDSGMRPDGTTPLEHGDRVYVQDTSKYYTVYPAHIYSRSKDSRNITISCPANGMKPDISISVEMIPGQVCYKMTLKIRNLNISSVDIRKWDHMTIRAGYAGRTYSVKKDGKKQIVHSGSSTEFICPIFSSFVESPNPDGITTFIGLTVGSVVSPLRQFPVNVIFPEVFTVGGLITAVGSHLCTGPVQIKNQLIDEINNMVIDNEKYSIAQAANSYELLVWLQSTLNDVASAYNPKAPPRILVQLSSNYLTIFATNIPNKVDDDSSREQVVDLSGVYNVAFNGSQCTLEAPWNPRIQPGSLFYMPPTYFQAPWLMNTMDPAIYRNKDNRYRVLTQSIQFSTTGGVNKMAIVAVPEQYVKPFRPRQDTAFTQKEIGELYAEHDSKESKDYREGTINIPSSIVDKHDVEKETKESVLSSLFEVPIVDKTTVAWVTLKVNSHAPHSSDEYTGHCYSDIAENFYEKLGLKSLQVDPKDKSKVVTTASLWPLILVATYQMRHVKKNMMYWDVKMDDPDYVQDEVNLLVPSFTDPTYKVLKPLADVFYYAYRTYTEYYVGVHDHWLDQWAWLYKYLTGRDV